jgi:tape measure domain-containing protein
VSVVANVAINVDSSGAVSKLRQVQQGAQATSQAVDKLNATTAATSNKFKIAANGIKYFTDAAGRARAENGRFLTSTERAAAGLEAQGRAAQQASGKFNGLRNALASLGAGLAVRKAFVDASELESAQARIGLLTKNFSQLTGIQEVAANAAKKFNLSQSESLGALTDLGNRIGPTGASLQDVANVYEGFNTLLALNKVNSQNAASATLQLNQALGSGRLAGEEFNAISEATPQLLDAVAKVLGRNRGELKQLASDGKISSQVLIDALTRIRTEGAADLETAFGGAFGATRRFNAALEDFSATVGTELLPALTPLINKATEILKLFGELPGPVKTTAVAILGLTAAFVVLAPAVAAVSLAAAPWLALAAGIAAAGLAILDAANAQRDFNNVIATAPLPDVNAKIQELESKLRAAETKLADVTAQFGPLSREAAFAQASVDGLKGSLDLAKGDYKIRLLFESVGVKPDARFFGPGFAAPAAPTRATPTPTTGTGTGKGAGTSKAADDAARIAKQIKDQQAAATELAATELGRLTIAETADGVQRQITQSIVQQEGIQREYTTKLNESKSAQETLNLQIAQQNALKTNALELEAALAQEIDNLTQPLQEILDESKQRLELENRYQKLLADGVNPELVKEFAQLELTAEKQTQLLTLRLARA